MPVSDFNISLAANYIKNLAAADIDLALRKLAQKLTPALRRRAIVIMQEVEKASSV